MTRHTRLQINGVVSRVDGIALEDYLLDWRGYIVHYAEILLYLIVRDGLVGKKSSYIGYKDFFQRTHLIIFLLLNDLISEGRRSCQECFPIHCGGENSIEQGIIIQVMDGNFLFHGPVKRCPGEEVRTESMGRPTGYFAR